MTRNLLSLLCLTACSIATPEAPAQEPASEPRAPRRLSERSVQECACARLQLEVMLPSGTRADCVSDTHAIEVEATQDWAQGIGQSLHYAEQLDKKAFVFLFCERQPETCLSHQLRLESTIAAHGLPVEWEFVPDVCMENE